MGKQQILIIMEVITVPQSEDTMDQKRIVNFSKFLKSQNKPQDILR